MLLTVHRVTIPAWSTVGYGQGNDSEGQAWEFVGGHRPMRHLGEAVQAAGRIEDLPTTDVEAWQLVGSIETARDRERR